MPLIDCSDGPVPIDPPEMADHARLLVRLWAMADELDAAFPLLPPDLENRTLCQAAAVIVRDFATALLAWCEAEEANRG